MKTVTRPGEINYIALENAELRYPVMVGKKKVVLKWHNYNLTLNVKEDEKVIQAIDELIESQWAKDEKGDFVVAQNGELVIGAKKRKIPFRKYDDWANSIQKTPVRLQLDPTNPDSAIEATPEEIMQGLELLKNKETIKNEEVN